METLEILITSLCERRKERAIESKRKCTGARELERARQGEREREKESEKKTDKEIVNDPNGRLLYIILGTLGVHEKGNLTIDQLCVCLVLVDAGDDIFARLVLRMSPLPFHHGYMLVGPLASKSTFNLSSPVT